MGNVVIVAKNRPTPMYATILIVIGAFVIAKVFSVVFSCALDTLFVCCCRDKNEYAGTHMPDNLKKAFGFDKKSKKEASAEEGEDLVAK